MPHEGIEETLIIWIQERGWRLICATAYDISSLYSSFKRPFRTSNAWNLVPASPDLDRDWTGWITGSGFLPFTCNLVSAIPGNVFRLA
jgi:hypothetical protein